LASGTFLCAVSNTPYENILTMVQTAKIMENTSGQLEIFSDMSVFLTYADLENFTETPNTAQ